MTDNNSKKYTKGIDDVFDKHEEKIFGRKKDKPESYTNNVNEEDMSSSLNDLKESIHKHRDTESESIENSMQRLVDEVKKGNEWAKPRKLIPATIGVVLLTGLLVYCGMYLAIFYF